MKLLQVWKDELVELVNRLNSLTITESDVVFSITQRDASTGAVSVTIAPSEGSKYFNEQSLVYIPRDVSKNFLGIPLRFVVAGDTTIQALVEQVATKYGIPFDTTVDFLEEELKKAVEFTTSGQQTVEVPIADSSFVWVGKLVINVANDALDLRTIIANFTLTELKYLQSDTAVGSLDIATVGYKTGNFWRLPTDVRDSISKEAFTDTLSVLVAGEAITQADMDAILADETGDTVSVVITDNAVNHEDGSVSHSMVLHTVNSYTTDNYSGKIWAQYAWFVPAP